MWGKNGKNHKGKMVKGLYEESYRTIGVYFDI